MLDLHCCDNMELMAKYPDGHFDLAIVDPPYGLDFSQYKRGGIRTVNRYTKDDIGKWDENIPTEDYFNELFRVSKNQIIWGGNYFPLPPSRGILFWFKHQPAPTYSHGELAWTSFDRPAKCFDFPYYGNIEGHTNCEQRIHPTQKPIKLYDFCLKNYAEPGHKILDTHMGSGSIAISCHYNGFDLVACEKDPIIFEKAKKRISEKTIQVKLELS